MENNMKLLKNKKLALAISIVFSIALIASSLTFAQGYGRRGGGGYGYAQQAPDRGPVLRTEMFNARTTILAEMTDESQDNIKAKLRYKPMWAVMDEYKIDYAEFSKKMTAKRAEIIKQAAADGKISQDRAEFMLDRNSDDYGPGMRYGKRGWRAGCR